MNSNLSNADLVSYLQTMYEDNIQQINNLQQANSRIRNLFINLLTVPLSRSTSSATNPNTINLWTSNASVNTFLRNLYVNENEDETEEQNNSFLTDPQINVVVDFCVHQGPNITCPITLSELSDGSEIGTIRFCKHTFLASAVRQWLQSNFCCPVCRCDVRRIE